MNTWMITGDGLEFDGFSSISTWMITGEGRPRSLLAMVRVSCATRKAYAIALLLKQCTRTITACFVFLSCTDAGNGEW
jgi:hypothetical protein